MQLGTALANSPEFALAWTKKVCAWLNSAPCSADDPELVRVSKAFAASDYNFNQLVKSLVTSPLTTYKTETKTATDRGVVVTMARTDQLCQTYSSRFDLNDLCVRRATTYPWAFYQGVGSLLAKLPTDTYSRATPTLIQATTPGLTQRIGLENACIMMTPAIVDNSVTGSRYNSRDPNALTRMLTEAMGLDPVDDADVLQVLRRHHDDVYALTKDATHAMRSTFVLACTSPAMAMIGL